MVTAAVDAQVEMQLQLHGIHLLDWRMSYFGKPVPTFPGHARLSDPLVTLDLAAMHDAPRLGIERIAPMQDREIVPHEQVADLPLVAHGELRLRRVRPQRVEQRLALGHVRPST